MSDIRLAPTVFIATDSSAMEAVLDLQMRIRRHNEGVIPSIFAFGWIGQLGNLRLFAGNRELPVNVEVDGNVSERYQKLTHQACHEVLKMARIAQTREQELKVDVSRLRLYVISSFSGPTISHILLSIANIARTITDAVPMQAICQCLLMLADIAEEADQVADNRLRAEDMRMALHESMAAQGDPAFEVCYLIDRMNQEGLRLDSNQQLVELVATFLDYLTFSPLGPEIDNLTLSNHRYSMQSVWPVYASVGLVSYSYYPDAALDALSYVAKETIVNALLGTESEGEMVSDGLTAEQITSLLGCMPQKTSSENNPESERTTYDNLKQKLGVEIRNHLHHFSQCSNGSLFRLMERVRKVQGEIHKVISFLAQNIRDQERLIIRKVAEYHFAKPMEKWDERPQGPPPWVAPLVAVVIILMGLTAALLSESGSQRVVISIASIGLAFIGWMLLRPKPPERIRRVIDTRPGIRAELRKAEADHKSYLERDAVCKQFMESLDMLWNRLSDFHGYLAVNRQDLLGERPDGLTDECRSVWERRIGKWASSAEQESIFNRNILSLSDMKELILENIDKARKAPATFFSQTEFWQFLESSGNSFGSFATLMDRFCQQTLSGLLQYDLEEIFARKLQDAEPDFLEEFIDNIFLPAKPWWNVGTHYTQKSILIGVGDGSRSLLSSYLEKADPACTILSIGDRENLVVIEISQCDSREVLSRIS